MRLFTLACVVDVNPRFYVELVLWTHCVKRFLPADRFRPIVCHLPGVPSELLSWVKDSGIATVEVHHTIAGSPHCNKIAPLLLDQDDDYCIVVDTDLYFVRDISCFFRSRNIRAAPNNHCNPPRSIYEKIFSAAAVGFAYRPGLALFKGFGGLRETHINNISAGITAVPREHRYVFAQLWSKWARWLVSNQHLMERWAVHVDQVAFALAVEEIGMDVEFLPPQTNCVPHLLPEVSDIYGFHLSTAHIPEFPTLFAADKHLTGDNLSEGAKDAIARLNTCIKVAVTDIRQLRSVRDHLDKFLAPEWRRPTFLVPN